ncbi:Phosphatidylinositol-4-phosphate 5-kinase [Orbilia blumenaviensis]|uniref:1-phosphatidylinositol-4-phosphate 5-kinase n=1 Tax=Orbilia blumenaviensis TaxID=1796055 RepID=A0AAV9UP68_9PEZI
MTVEENHNSSQYAVIVHKLPIDILDNSPSSNSMHHHPHHHHPHLHQHDNVSPQKPFLIPPPPTSPPPPPPPTTTTTTNGNGNSNGNQHHPEKEIVVMKRDERREDIPVLATTPASPNGTNTSRTLVAADSSITSTSPSSPPKRHSSPMSLDHSSSSPSPNGPLKHRHTLQVPKPSSSSSSSRYIPVHSHSAGILAASTSQSDDIITKDHNPIQPHLPHSGAPRRASISLGRRPTRSLHSDVHLDEIPQDEDSAKWTEAIRAKRASKRRKKEEEVEDEVLVGTKVDINHSNYVTMYNMLTGIRFVVSRCNAKVDRPLTDADFDAAHKFSFDIMGSELTPSAKYDFKFKDYAPWVFRHLRARFNIDPGDYLMSLTHRYILSELGSPGKSGSFFYFSRDYKYIIKTIHHAEHRYLRHILRDYYNHVTKYPDTLISQFFGLHRVKIPFGPKIHFVIMNNIFPPHKDIHMTFDLKGSHIGREYKETGPEENPKAVLKDLNWESRNMHLCLGPRKHELFVQQAQLDVALLQRLKIMDYSLLVGIHDMHRGNNDNLREKNLQVFQPGGSANDEMGPHPLTRTPSRLESARKRAEMRKLINSEVPVSLEHSDTPLPEEMLARANEQGARSIFNQDEHGFRATDENDEPGEVIYYLGIIDCLTKYNFIKRAEHFWKGLSQDKTEISAVPPQAYGDRFFRYVSKIIQPASASDRGIPRAAPAGSRNNDSTENPPSTETGMPDRVRSNVRSPSTERPSTTLPVVEEVGEGSSGARSRSRSDSPETSHHQLHHQTEVPDVQVRN